MKDLYKKYIFYVITSVDVNYISAICFLHVKKSEQNFSKLVWFDKKMFWIHFYYIKMIYICSVLYFDIMWHLKTFDITFCCCSILDIRFRFYFIYRILLLFMLVLSFLILSATTLEIKWFTMWYFPCVYLELWESWRKVSHPVSI